MRKALLISLLFVALGSSPAWGYVCSTDGAEADVPKCATTVELVGNEEPLEVKEFLLGGQWLLYKSIEITAPLYLCLMGIGLFRRYIRGRI